MKIETAGVSVYVPTRNRAQLLSRALRSVLAQTYSRYEIIVVDDASDDETRKVIHEFESSGRIRAFRLDRPRGAPAARNLAIRHANFDLVTGLDDDDVWLPERLERMVAEFAASVGFVAASDIVELGDDVRYIARRPARIDANRLLRRNVVGNQVLARRKDIVDCGGFDESLTASQDYDLWIRLVLKAGPGIGLSEPLQVINAHAQRSRITTSTRRRKGVWHVYRKYVGLMSREQRKSHLFNLIRTTDRNLTLRKLMTLWNLEDASRLIAHFLRSHHALPTGWIESLVQRIDRSRIEAAMRPASVRQQARLSE
jgi:glycosyltransferase involved in cell wall biosynthesis